MFMCVCVCKQDQDEQSDHGGKSELYSVKEEAGQNADEEGGALEREEAPFKVRIYMF